jgi:4-aminobutyrate aminotransferase
VFHAPYPNPYRCSTGNAADCSRDCLAYIENHVLTHLVSPDEVAAIVVEPIQGEGGYIVPPAEFLQGLASIAAQHGMLLVADEVQSGIGRTGKMFAIEHAGVQPDIIVAAKGIASGLPMGVTIARDDVMDWPVGAHSNTFGGNPLACAAALATIKLVEEGLMNNAADVGQYLQSEVEALSRRHRLIGNVRGRGLMIGMELVRDRATKERATHERDALVMAAFQRGLLVLAAGANTIRLSPPLVITKEQAATAVAILNDALLEVSNS